MSKHTNNTASIPGADTTGAPASLHLGVDIGGTHISAALALDGVLLSETYRRAAIDPAADASMLLDAWAELMNAVIALAPASAIKDAVVRSIGLAMPGPFDYANGIAMIRGLNKYESLYGLNIREALRDRLADSTLPIAFANDAACFGLGGARAEAAAHRKVIAITLGTGFGACFVGDKTLVTAGPGVPPNGYLYNIPFKDGIAEDYISARWLLSTGKAKDVRAMAEQAMTHGRAFTEFGTNLGLFLAPWIKAYEADALVIGGSISQAFGLFGPAMQTAFAQKGVEVAVVVATNTEHTAIAGAAGLTEQRQVGVIPARKSLQARLPKNVETTGRDGYHIYPFEPLGNGHLFPGYASLARWILGQKGVRLDGFAGIDWNLVRHELCSALRKEGVTVLWYETSAWQKPETAIETLVKPFLGQEGSVWGTKTTLTLADFYTKELVDWEPGADTVVILAGTGAGLSRWEAPILYFDLPKNELQYRMRAGSATNLGQTGTGPSSEMYKRSYFVDWPVLNQHRRAICDAIILAVDGQREEDPNWALLDSIRRGMQSVAVNLIRARPWFEPGVWGGQWMKQHIPALSREEVNYAWSFELIAPENGVVFESDGLLLEIAFDWLMQWESKAIMGIDAHRFGEEFPIRFDFLDTFGGGNLSIQCHPSLPYIQENFGETITQDETYYILDCKPGAGVYLGFNEDIDPATFRQALEKSQASNQAIDIEEYVQLLPARKHDLFLIPNQTIHGAGINNLVLEISATPYIFTFKMYDWMRLDLEGMPRPINIRHAFHNLDFTRKGCRVQEELISRPQLLQSDDEVQLELLPTHPEHFYSIHRITLTGSTRISTEGRCHLLMLVEGKTLTIKTNQGKTYTLQYAETVVLPAAAGAYQLINPESTPVKIIKAFVK
jgi:predicted NBD/HSP70 family sugar kinase/mannose-6-phosphate isomerase class I